MFPPCHFKWGRFILLALQALYFEQRDPDKSSNKKQNFKYKIGLFPLIFQQSPVYPVF